MCTCQPALAGEHGRCSLRLDFELPGRVEEDPVQDGVTACSDETAMHREPPCRVAAGTAGAAAGGRVQLRDQWPGPASACPPHPSEAPLEHGVRRHRVGDTELSQSCHQDVPVGLGSGQ